MLFKDFEGLKFPVEYVTRYFFKEKLHTQSGRVLELGSGNGNNLMLFYQYGWDVVGADIDPELIKQADHNFKLTGLKNHYEHVAADMVEFVEKYQGEPFDAFLMPHSIYYLPMDQIVRLLDLIKSKKLIKPNASFFLTVRTPEDYRFGRGKQIGDKTYELAIDETGEKGCTITFFSEFEIIELLKKYFTIDSLHVSRQLYGNFMHDRLVNNSDITIWGNITIRK
ncbi:MAG: class I SAM-dependent methyltransferase [Patescibacteria group bacterium]|jgi:SAM-dependent methyltransferase